ncbi:hypothetical protein ABIF65_006397 [Bradyrhizobium japonicum]|uniref:hypothetical protein n=1 Tax=Bradyrhizobium TaxID=374 RepID=UPI00041A37BF|nr:MULTISPECIES: hypothetical protein [Bradyrhizobium]MBR0876183.1 hypothetical protein [Bradyrhizobium liaoningense]MBR0944062.1 hypothetical protein [Bradyrhizobium liaoningense]MBR0996436.1 hypothetical protein [Bradyrhizobium liaoningense]MBR1027009.1 hypothetical protein [Bradyrhizobium liaoningense]MBR1062573.1 hypothetical protein [Bradyrhizobium liaoningense]
MTAVLRRLAPPSLDQQLRAAPAMTRPLMLDIIDQACRRFPSRGRSERSARIMRLVDAEAWTDAALALIELELPMWQVRRIAYDEGEWHCALSRERELPDWLDAAVEARHADLALALLSAFIEVQALAVEVSRPSVPTVRPARDPLYQPVACENFS